jgi:hypothetical protein
MEILAILLIVLWTMARPRKEDDLLDKKSKKHVYKDGPY